MTFLDDNKECAFARFFKEMGYDYSWDFSSRLGESWHELYKKDRLIFQVDRAVSLEKIVKDLCIIEEFECRYFVHSPNQKVYDKFCNHVRTFVAEHPEILAKYIQEETEQKQGNKVTIY